MWDWGLATLAFSREAWEVLTQASEVYLRTERHPTVRALQAVPDLRLLSFDEVYEQTDAFADVYQTISARILELAQRPQGWSMLCPAIQPSAKQRRSSFSKARPRGA